MVVTTLLIAAVTVYTAVAAAVDLRLHRIPNYVTVPAAVLGLAYHTFWPSGAGPLTSLAGIGVGFALLLFPFLFGGAGAGDVKLLAALGAWLGPLMMLIAFGASSAVAACIAMLLLAYDSLNRGVGQTRERYLSQGKNLKQSKQRRKIRLMPFAVPVALSTWGLLVWLVATKGFAS